MTTVVQLRPSQAEKPTVNPGRDSNEAYRVREYMTEPEIDQLIAAAGKGRNPERDRLLIMMAFRHALRLSELVGIKWEQVDLKAATLHVRRVKGSVSGIHGLDGAELRLLRALRRDNPHAAYVFMSERKAPMSTDGAQKLTERLGETAGLPFPIYAHMLAPLCWIRAGWPWRGYQNHPSVDGAQEHRQHRDLHRGGGSAGTDHLGPLRPHCGARDQRPHHLRRGLLPGVRRDS
jgi:integrase